MSILIRLTSFHRYQEKNLDDLVTHLLDQQLDDGGWNCATLTDKGKHSSFHTSIQALEALDAYAGSGGPIETGEATRRGREFFLAHKLYQSHRTGEVAVRGSTKFPAFPEWHFDVMRGLEYFHESAAPRDPRLGDAIEVIRKARRRDGAWSTYKQYAGRQWFEFEQPGASRVNTRRALGILRWWDS